MVIQDFHLFIKRHLANWLLILLVCFFLRPSFALCTISPSDIDYMNILIVEDGKERSDFKSYYANVKQQEAMQAILKLINKYYIRDYIDVTNPFGSSITYIYITFSAKGDLKSVRFASNNSISIDDKKYIYLGNLLPKSIHDNLAELISAYSDQMVWQDGLVWDIGSI